MPAPPPTPDAAFDPTPYSGREAIDADFEALIKKYFEWKKEQADSQSKQVAAESIALDKEVKKLLPKPEALKPLPLTPIPDDPPPHEGALIDLPCIIEPPDLIIVEVLEASPAVHQRRALVRPTVVLTSDSMVRFMSARLTLTQAKEKIVLQLRKFLSDEVLGLIASDAESNKPYAVAARHG